MRKPRGTPRDDTVLVQDNEPEAEEYVCGRCGSTLLVCVGPASVQGAILLCNRCGAYNVAEGAS
jgi:hypothetical protein